MPLDTTLYLSVSLWLLTGALLLQGCSSPPTTVAQTPSSIQLTQAQPSRIVTEPAAAAPKSLQQIAQEAMNSKGKLTKAQIAALIRANAACRPGDKHDKRGD
ncbi:MAG: hypothetical protein ACK4RS_04980 [Thiothrix sp.]